jgi:hypothetical protein
VVPFRSHFLGDHLLSEFDDLPDGKEADLKNPSLAKPQPNRLLEFKKSETNHSGASGYQEIRMQNIREPGHQETWKRKNFLKLMP